jgi:hypothetical protein
MSSQFNGKHVYQHNYESSPIFEIRDGHIYKAHSAGAPLYRIDGHVIVTMNTAERAFEIEHDKYIVPHGGGAPIYDIR